MTKVSHGLLKMSLLLKQSIAQVKCEFVGHQVLKTDEDRLFYDDDDDNGNDKADRIHNHYYTTCYRCGAKVVLKKSQRSENEYYVAEY